MSTLSANEIRQLRREIVLRPADVMCFRDIVAGIMRLHPDATNRTTIEAQIATFLVGASREEISKPTRGLYMPP